MCANVRVCVCACYNELMCVYARFDRTCYKCIRMKLLMCSGLYCWTCYHTHAKLYRQTTLLSKKAAFSKMLATPPWFMRYTCSVCARVCMSIRPDQRYLHSLALKHSIRDRKLNVLYLPQPQLRCSLYWEAPLTLSHLYSSLHLLLYSAGPAL